MRPEQLVQFLHLILLWNIGKFILERREIVELLTVQEIQQVEQLFQIILQRRTRQKQLVGDTVPGQQSEKLQKQTIESQKWVKFICNLL